MKSLRHFLLLCAGAAAALPCPALHAEVKLPSIFSDNLVLQGSDATPVWGWAAPGESVTVQCGATHAKATANAEGRWKLHLDLSKTVSDATELKITGDHTAQPLTIHNVMIGEVWLASGQSNMEKPVGLQPGQHPCENWEEVVAHSKNPAIRVYTMQRRASDKPEDDCPGKWEEADTKTTAHFTAAGYFFAVDVQRELKRPVGVINCTWGGTLVEAWTSINGFAKDPDLQARAQKELDTYHNYPRLMHEYHEALITWTKANHCEDSIDPAKDKDKLKPFADPAAFTDGWTPVNLGSGKKGSIVPGVHWYRANVTIPDDWKGEAANLSLGVLPGFESVYFNGVRIGGHDLKNPEGIQAPRRFLVPPSLIKPGEATIAIRLVCHLPTNAVMDQAWRTALVSKGPSAKIGPWTTKTEATFPTLDEAALNSYPHAPQTLYNSNVSSFLFNAMVHPLIPYRIAGALWYQGESNESSADLYFRTFPNLIRDWRQNWDADGGSGKFDFYFCQLANFKGKSAQPVESKWALLREAQRYTLSVPHTGMAVLIDIGEERDIHPVRKQAVGHRLALQALADTYHKTVESSGPMYHGMAIEGSGIRLQFSHLGGGLVAQPLPDTYQPLTYETKTEPLVKPRPGSPLQGFAIAGADGKYVWADAKIDGDTVYVSSLEIKEPKTVRYAWSDNPTCNLYNAAGLPASPFSTAPEEVKQ